MSPPKLVIFDCDGVLVDSEPISISVLRDIVSEAGLEIPEDVAYRRFLGRSMATITHILAEEFGLAVLEEHLDEIRDRLYARFRQELKPIAGIAETIDRLSLPFCVASSSQPERIRLSLRLTGLLDRFEPNIYSATMVKNGKPAPDLFLHAADAMRAAPADCLVIEDSSAGIEAARRAGMRVFAFVGGSHASSGRIRATAEAMGPDAIFDDMRQLPHMIGSAASLAI